MIALYQNGRLFDIDIITFTKLVEGTEVFTFKFPILFCMFHLIAPTRDYIRTVRYFVTLHSILSEYLRSTHDSDKNYVL